MKEVFVPVVVEEDTKDFIIYNVVASQKEYWSVKEMKEILEDYGIFLSLEEVKEKIKELVSNELLIRSYENNGRGLVYRFI